MLNDKMDNDRKVGLVIIMAIISAGAVGLTWTGLPTSSQTKIDYEMYLDQGFNQPTELQYSTDLDGLLVLEQGGIVKLVTITTTEIFLDISDRVVSGGEQGLLGIAVHPDYNENGLFYVDYTADDPLRTVIAEFSVTDQNLGDNNSERVILEVEQPYTNHNAGTILFGPDGYLYITLGDGGSGGDPENNGQDPGTLLGSILRIDVNKSGVDTAYQIPSDNPFVNSSTSRPEVFAYGLRNPWKMSYDNISQRLIAADVGQNSIEEVNFIEAGKNYGWNEMEGYSCYLSNCNTTGKKLPFTQYTHSVGNSITGGYVNRNTFSSLYGQYIYGDFGAGTIFSYNISDLNSEYQIIVETSFLISTLGILESGDIIFADYSSGTIYKLIAEPAGNEEGNEEKAQDNSNPSTEDNTTESFVSTTEPIFNTIFITLIIIIIGIKKYNRHWLKSD